jgi:hypothetical protein
VSHSLNDSSSGVYRGSGLIALRSRLSYYLGRKGGNLIILGRKTGKDKCGTCRKDHVRRKCICAPLNTFSSLNLGTQLDSLPIPGQDLRVNPVVEKLLLHVLLNVPKSSGTLRLAVECE